MVIKIRYGIAIEGWIRNNIEQIAEQQHSNIVVLSRQHSENVVCKSHNPQLNAAVMFTQRDMMCAFRIFQFAKRCRTLADTTWSLEDRFFTNTTGICAADCPA